MSRIPQDTEKPTRIYTLTDPRTKEIRYVGKTIKTLQQRLTAHLYDINRTKTHKSNWIREVMSEDLTPIIEEIETLPWNVSQEAEMYWIAQFQAWGFRLVNLTKGGEGTLGRVGSELQRQRMREVNNRGVYQFGLSGEFIQYWNSITTAANALGTTATKISAVCRGRRKRAGDFLWSYDAQLFVPTYHRNFEYPATLTLFGITKTIVEWSAEVQISRTSLYRRYKQRKRCDSCILNPSKARCQHIEL